LIGYNYYNSTVSSCYATVSVSGSSGYVGGLIGSNYYNATVSSCYATGSVAGESNYVGGLIGLNQYNSTVSSSYATGEVSGEGDNVGDLVGKNNSSEVSNCYYNSETATQNKGIGVDDNSQIVTGLTTSQMKQSSNFTDWDFTTTPDWEITEDISFPRLVNVEDAPIVLAMLDLSAQVSEEYNHPIQVITMDNEVVSVALLTYPEGMTISNDSVLSWTPTAVGDYVLEIKATDDTGLFSTYSCNIQSSPFNGSGTESDPYQIASLDDLINLSEYTILWDSYFIQTAHIDASATDTLNAGSGFSPIGNSTTMFTGNYNGQDYAIDSLSINRSSTYNVGLFGYTCGASIDSLGLTNVNIKGKTYVGGLIGYNYNNSTVSSCYATGSVAGSGNYVGGLIGYNYFYSTVSSCYATVSVSGSSDYVGGLIGYNFYNSTVSSCYATGSISGDDYVGGLIGYNYNNTTVSSCYASGSVAGSGNYIGGLVGYNYWYSKVTNCYSTGSISGDDYVGGLLGYNVLSSEVNNCYSTGSVSGSESSVGGLVGNNYNSSTVSISYYNSETSGQSLGIGEDDNSQTVTALTTTEMKQDTTFSDWDFDTNWGIMVDSTYPALLGVSNNAPFAFADTLEIGTSINLSTSVLANDYDFETAQDSLTYKIVSYPEIGTISDNIYAFNSSDATGTQDTLIYCVGELLAGGDTLWGNYATVLLTKMVNSAPELTAVSDISIDENTSVTLSLSDVSVSDAQDDVLSLLIANGENYTIDDYTITPTIGYYGALSVDIAVTDGVLNSDTIAMTITVNAAPDTTIITWESPDTTVYGAAIGSDAMNATASNTEGAISYSFASDSIFDAGTYQLIATFTPTNSNEYTATGDTVEYIVSTLPITVTADAGQTKIYGESDSTLTYTQSADLIDGNSISGTLNREEGEDVGTYAITLGDLSAGSNYNVTFETADFTISTKAITVTVDANQTKTYGESDPTLTYALSADLIDGDAFSGTLSRDEGEDVGAYAITQGDLSVGSNYDVTFELAEFTITKAALTATADDQPVIQGAEMPEFTITYSGFVNGDTESDLNELPTASATATSTSDLGEYVITVAGGSDNNYELTNVDGTLTITDKQITELTWETPANAVYGSATGADIMNAQSTVDGTITYSFAADSVFDAGTYQLQADFIPTNSNEYTSAVATVEYVVTKAVLTATADDQTIGEDDEIPTLTITYDGFVNNESESELDELPTASVTATSTSDAGEYVVTVAGGSDNNYDFSYVEGTLTISLSTAISELSGETISVYPNPATTVITVKGSTGIATLYNLAGAKVLIQDLNQGNCINISALPGGLYLLSVDGKSLKVVKE
jgi:hypothetical protein